jgi:hypothetical protein
MLQFVRLAVAKELGCHSYSAKADEMVQRVLKNVGGGS